MSVLDVFGPATINLKELLGPRMSEEPTVSLVDVLEEDEELEQEASAVLAGSDSDHCSYPQVSPALPQRWNDRPHTPR